MIRYYIGAAVALLLVSAGFLLSAVAGATPEGRTNTVIAYGGLFLASVATLTGVYFGWRKDRREAKKFRLEIELLEKQRDETPPK